MLSQFFLDRMKQQLGEEYPAFVECLSGEEYKALRRNPLKISDEAFRVALPFLGERVPWTEEGYYYGKENQPGLHPFHQAGLYYIQEPSAMAAAEKLQAAEGERILDLCAAPGGKSTQIAGKMAGRGLLVCNEPHPARAKILSENVERMGICNGLVTCEQPARLERYFSGFFDKILVDAPCSGEGMFRKNEEAVRQWSPENVRLCARRQDEILDSAARMLQPGGRLVYSTCTFSEEENEGSIERFIQRHPQFCIKESLRLWPHRIKGEGHFVAVLEKEGHPEEVILREQKRAGKQETEEFHRFVRENLKTDRDWRLCLFGDQLYHLPEGTPDLSGLKVLRAGLHLGTMKKNRFEPSHALALALKSEEVNRVCDLSCESRTVTDYLEGKTFSGEGEKGWYLITVEGCSLGWGKLAGGIMKNHYPKGLRIAK